MLNIVKHVQIMRTPKWWNQPSQWSNCIYKVPCVTKDGLSNNIKTGHWETKSSCSGQKQRWHLELGALPSFQSLDIFASSFIWFSAPVKGITSADFCLHPLNMAPTISSRMYHEEASIKFQASDLEAAVFPRTPLGVPEFIFKKMFSPSIRDQLIEGSHHIPSNIWCIL